MLYFDWLVDSVSHNRVSLFNVELEQDYLLAQLSYFDMMLSHATIELFDRHNIKRATLLIPPPFRTFTEGVGICVPLTLKCVSEATQSGSTLRLDE